MVVEAKIALVGKKLAQLPIRLQTKEQRLSQARLNSEMDEHQNELKEIMKKLIEFVSQTKHNDLSFKQIGTPINQSLVETPKKDSRIATSFNISKISETTDSFYASGPPSDNEVKTTLATQLERLGRNKDRITDETPNDSDLTIRENF